MDEFKKAFEDIIRDCALRPETLGAMAEYLKERKNPEKLQGLFLEMHQEWLSQGGQFALPWAVKFLKPTLYNSISKINLLLREYDQIPEEEEENDDSGTDDALDQRERPRGPLQRGLRGEGREELFLLEFSDPFEESGESEPSPELPEGIPGPQGGDQGSD